MSKMTKIVKEFDNKLLGRNEVVAEVANPGATLSRQEAKKELAKKLKAKEELIIIENITSHFGEKSSTVTAFVYNDEATLKKITLKHILKRNEAPAPQEAEAEA